MTTSSTWKLAIRIWCEPGTWNDIFGFRQLYLKFEGNNPTGTQKDRIAFAQCLDSLRRGYQAITVATCGNYGAAIAVAAKLAGLKSIICIPETYSSQRIDEMSGEGAEIRRIPGSYEACRGIFQEIGQRG